MKSTILPILLLIGFGILSCKGGKYYDCYGLHIPDFKNSGVDSLVRLDVDAICATIRRLEKGEKITQEELEELGRVFLRFQSIFELLDKDGDQAEIDKFGSYNRNRGKKMNEFGMPEKIKKNLEAQ